MGRTTDVGVFHHDSKGTRKETKSDKVVLTTAYTIFSKRLSDFEYVQNVKKIGLSIKARYYKK